MQYIGKLDIGKLEAYREKITTNKVMISFERMEHIKNHHPEIDGYNLEHIQNVIKEPDYIFQDKKNDDDTILMIKTIKEIDKIYRVVVRLHTNSDSKENSNTIISFWNISKKKLGQYKRNEEIIFQKLDNSE